MRRATEAMGHKTASAYGYATHAKPQGFIIRPPLLNTNKKCFSEEHGFNEATNRTDTTYKAGSTAVEGRRVPALPRRSPPTHTLT